MAKLIVRSMSTPLDLYMRECFNRCYECLYILCYMFYVSLYVKIKCLVVSKFYLWFLYFNENDKYKCNYCSVTDLGLLNYKSNYFTITYLFMCSHGFFTNNFILICVSVPSFCQRNIVHILIVMIIIHHTVYSFKMKVLKSCYSQSIRMVVSSSKIINQILWRID